MFAMARRHQHVIAVHLVRCCDVDRIQLREPHQFLEGFGDRAFEVFRKAVAELFTWLSSTSQHHFWVGLNDGNHDRPSHAKADDADLYLLGIFGLIHLSPTCSAERWVLSAIKEQASRKRRF